MHPNASSLEGLLQLLIALVIVCTVLAWFAGKLDKRLWALYVRSLKNVTLWVITAPFKLLFWFCRTQTKLMVGIVLGAILALCAYCYLNP